MEHGFASVPCLAASLTHTISEEPCSTLNKIQPSSQEHKLPFDLQISTRNCSSSRSARVYSIKSRGTHNISNRCGEYMQDNTTQSIKDKSVNRVKYLIMWVMNNKENQCHFLNSALPQVSLPRGWLVNLTLPKL